jgi:nanoRNase/pAp phosphatase (c-di-AMP/oligoRNAs hydrolase)
MEPSLDRLFDALGEAHFALIMPHNDPDPDAIASAAGLSHLLVKHKGIESRIVHRGIVGRAENKALVRYLKNPLHPLTASDLARGSPILLVDTQPGTGNNALPKGAVPAVVLDHHPRQSETDGVPFADVRPDVGATSTILAEYLKASGSALPAPLATALFYGIKSDTMGLARNASPEDVATYLYLQPRIDIEALGDIERAQVPADYFRKLVTTLQATRIYGGVVVSYAGSMHRPDLAAEMADLLLRLQGAQWVIVMGTYEDELILAVRTRRRQGGAGLLVQQMVGSLGTAGGHGVMAAGHVPLQGQDPDSLFRELSQRALELLHVAPDLAGQSLMA